MAKILIQVQCFANPRRNILQHFSHGMLTGHHAKNICQAYNHTNLAHRWVIQNKRAKYCMCSAACYGTLSKTHPYAQQNEKLDQAPEKLENKVFKPALEHNSVCNNQFANRLPTSPSPHNTYNMWSSSSHNGRTCWSILANRTWAARVWRIGGNQK